jgi:hypothetical protein
MSVQGPRSVPATFAEYINTALKAHNIFLYYLLKSPSSLIGHKQKDGEQLLFILYSWLFNTEQHIQASSQSYLNEGDVDRVPDLSMLFYTEWS